LLLQQSPDNSAAAEACFCQALDVARRQQAKSLELRGDELSALVATPRQTRRCSRVAGACVRVVRRGFRHARPPGGPDTGAPTSV